MNTIRNVLMMAVFAGMAATGSAATIWSDSRAATLCKTQAASQYAVGEQPARVTFKGIYGGNERRKVRMQILPVEGRPFVAICEVSRRGGEVVGRAPAVHPGRSVLAALVPD
jgi:hypothetical protein